MRPHTLLNKNDRMAQTQLPNPHNSASNSPIQSYINLENICISTTISKKMDVKPSEIGVSFAVGLEMQVSNSFFFWIESNKKVT